MQGLGPWLPARPLVSRSELSLQHADLELVPFKGTAFKAARHVLWSVCPLEDHHAPGAPSHS
eukprot:981828-Alexandrium_andersonii.AAC.1